MPPPKADALSRTLLSNNVNNCEARGHTGNRNPSAHEIFLHMTSENCANLQAIHSQLHHDRAIVAVQAECNLFGA